MGISAKPDHELESDADLTCQLCDAPLLPGDAMRVNGLPTCRACVVDVSTELAEKQADASSVPLGVLGALVGAALGAAVWVAIAIQSGYAIGVVAVLVGWLAGQGAVLATRGAHGRPLQGAAVIGAVLGLLAAKYGLFAADQAPLVAERDGTPVAYFTQRLVAGFFENLGESVRAFDVLWVFLAVTAAWRVPASPQVDVADA